jgi:hypothetical protein
MIEKWTVHTFSDIGDCNEGTSDGGPLFKSVVDGNGTARLIFDHIGEEAEGKRATVWFAKADLLRLSKLIRKTLEAMP